MGNQDALFTLPCGACRHRCYRYPGARPAGDRHRRREGRRSQSLTLNWISDLDFGTVAGDTLNPGTVSIDADTGARTTTGAVVALPSTFGRAQFDGFASPNQSVQLTLNQPAGGVIINGANSVGAVLDLDAGGVNRTTSSTGAFSVFVGGDFSIAANQAAGLYSAQFDLTADYQ